MGLFTAGTAFHVVAWRLRRPRRHLVALVSVFIVPLAVFLVLRILRWDSSAFDAAAVSLLYVSMVCAYIQVYPAAQAASPTLDILLIVGKGGQNGISSDAIMKAIDPQSLTRDRIRDLLDAGLVAETQGSGRLGLTPRGERLLAPFLGLRRLLGLPMGQG